MISMNLALFTNVRTSLFFEHTLDIVYVAVMLLAIIKCLCLESQQEMLESQQTPQAYLC